MDKGTVLVSQSPYGPAPSLQFVSVPQDTVLLPPHTQHATQQAEGSWFGPGWIPCSTPGRLIVPFYPAACCSMGGGGLNLDAEPAVRQVLLDRGGPEAVSKWVAVKGSLHEGLDGRCCVFGNVVLCMTGFGIPVVCYLEAKRQRVLRAWLADANQRVFAPAGMLAKFQTVTIVRSDGDGKVREEEYSWLAVALTAVEATALQAEPVFWRPIGCCNPQIGPDDCPGLKCCCCEPRCV